MALGIAKLFGSISYSASFDYENLKCEEIVVDDSTFTMVSYSGFDNWMDPGHVSLPAKQVFFSVPYNATDFSVTYSSEHVKAIGLTSPIYKTSLLTMNGDSLENIEREYKIDKHVVISTVGFAYGCNKFVGLTIFPIIQTENKSSVSFVSNLNISLDWVIKDLDEITDCRPIASIKNDGADRTRKMVENPECVDLNAYYEPVANVTDREDWEYIIICPKKLEKSLERLAAWRRAKGYGSRVFTIVQVLGLPYVQGGDGFDPTPDDASKLRAFLQGAYKNYGTQHVLLAGKYPNMPIKYIVGNPTDVYFSNLTTSWYMTPPGPIGGYKHHNYKSEINVGRIPFTTEQEVNNYIDKLIAYEYNPGNGNRQYLSTALMTRQNKGLMNWGSSHYYTNDSISEFTSLFRYGLDDNASVDPGPTGAEIINKINTNKYGVLNFIGHGSPEGITVSVIDHGSWQENYGVCGSDKDNYELIVENGNGIDLLTNYDYPSWAYSSACTTMPFDIYGKYTTEKYKYNFGESYIMSKGGGIAFFGNTRNSNCSQGERMMQKFFMNLKNAYSNSDFICGITAGEQMAICRTLTLSSDYYLKLMHNLLGDPLANLYYTDMNKLDCAVNNDGSVRIFGHKGEEPLYLCVTPLSDATYAYKRLFDITEWNNFVVDENKVCLVYGPYCLPVMLPAVFRNFSFEGNISRYIITGDLKCGVPTSDNIEENQVAFETGSDVTIESLGDVVIGNAIKFWPSSNLTIIAKGDVTLYDEIYISEGCHVKITADNVYYDRHSVYLEKDATLEIIERNAPQERYRARSVAEPEPRMVVEGRTWWYHAHASVSTQEQYDVVEIGLQIGGEIEKDGVKWHEINVVGDGITKKFGQDPVYTDDKYCISYIREDGDDVYVLIDSEALAHHPALENMVTDYTQWMFRVDNPFLMYHFGKVGDEFTTAFFDGKILSVSTIESVGHEFKSYEVDSSDNEVGLHRYVQIEGIGAFSDESLYGELFFAPFTPAKAGFGLEPPVLRYVTDGQGEIIYEAEGGLKLWEMLGVDNINADSTPGNCRWYNLQGVEISQPTAPGIYIRVSGDKAVKLTVD